jgi:AraC-like DNA-binding protein
MPSEGILALATNSQQNRQGFSVDQRVQEVIDSVNDDLRRNPSVTETAASVRLSPSRFSHLFKVDTGESPWRYLKQLRMERARELLEITSMKIKDIRDAVGMGDASHFVREFRRLYGASPTQYRLQHRRQSRMAK